MVSEGFTQCRPPLDASINCFVAGSNQWLPSLVLVVKSCRCNGIIVVVAVASVGNILLAWIKSLMNSTLQPSNFEITVWSARKRTINPYYPWCGNANSNLIAQSWPMELVGIPESIKRPRLLNPKVGAINRHTALSTAIPNIAMLPFNLKWKGRTLWVIIGKQVAVDRC